MKTLRFLLINLFVRDHKKTLEIINGLDNPNYIPKTNSKRIDFSSLLESDNSNDERVELKGARQVTHKDISNPTRKKSKRDEISESLKYLKSKPNKTKQDKDSIYTLEVLLKNMS